MHQELVGFGFIGMDEQGFLAIGHFDVRVRDTRLEVQDSVSKFQVNITSKFSRCSEVARTHLGEMPS